MFTNTQRRNLIVYSLYALAGASLMSVLFHGLLLMALPYYLSMGIIGYLAYVGYRTSHRIWTEW